MANTEISLQDIIARAKEMRKKYTKNLSDAHAAMFYIMFPEWKAGDEYIAGERIRVGTQLYRVLESHTAEEGKTPDVCDLFHKIDV